jgi:pimeloyl-ACP methyl ester carboxylesterase
VFFQISGMRWLRALATGIAGAYLVIGLLLYFEQDDLLFPAPKTYGKANPGNLQLPFEDLRIAITPTDYIHAWWIPAEASTENVVLMFHGNGYVLEDMVAAEAAQLREIGANLLLVDYRGYGGSSPAKPRESTVFEDARAALSYLRDRKFTPVGSIYVLGRSIGSGPATQLAVENPGLGGLILESPFSSIDDAARVLPVARIYPVHWMLRTHFDNLSKIGSVRAVAHCFGHGRYVDARLDGQADFR